MPTTAVADPLRLVYSSQEIATKTSLIGDMLARVSTHYTGPNFESLHPDDLQFIFGLYDALFFGHWLERTIGVKSRQPISFRLSSTMTSAGGKTILTRRRTPFGRTDEYEIAISGHLLFTNFRDSRRPVSVGGLVCPDRLSALQRIMEHEIIHLLEMLSDGKSSCARPQFKMLIANIFGHCEPQHSLITPRERAATEHAIRIGGLVEFEFKGNLMRGRVNRISHRATVLVQAAEGQEYSDGHRYRKYYIPLKMLRPVPVAL